MQRNLTPTAIVAAGALIGLGLYSGLSNRPIEAPPASVSGVTSTAAVADVPPAQSSVALVVPSASAVTSTTSIAGLAPAAIEQSAAKGLAREKKARFVDTCWKPALAKVATPATSVYSVHLSFDPEGKEVARGVSEVRGKDSRQDVARCLREQPLGIKLDTPPGRTAQVDLELTFP